MLDKPLRVRDVAVAILFAAAFCYAGGYAVRAASAGAGAGATGITAQQVSQMIAQATAGIQAQAQAAQATADAAVPSSGLSSAVMAVLPFSSTVPSAESVDPAAGTAQTIRRGDAVAPRITRATTVTTGAGGTFSGTWSSPLMANPMIVLTPISANASIDCQLTALPTPTTFQGRCFTAQTTSLNLTIITAGLTLNPVANTAAGVQVQVIALPPTQ